MASEHYCARCRHSFKAHVAGRPHVDGPARGKRAHAPIAVGGCEACRRDPFWTEESCPRFTERRCCDGLFDDPHRLACPTRHEALDGPVEMVSSWGNETVLVRFGDGPWAPVEASTPIYDAVPVPR